MMEMSTMALVSLAGTTLVPVERDPLRVYLTKLAPGSRRTMRQSLERVARLLSSDAMGADLLPWERLRYQHTQAVRTALLDSASPATANKMRVSVYRDHPFRSIVITCFGPS